MQDADTDTSDDELVLEVLEKYLLDREAGRAPNLSSWLKAYPDLEKRVTDCVEGLEALDQLSLAFDHDLSSNQFPHIADYEIIDELGRGGMGIVYQAQQLSLSRKVALKVLPMGALFDQKNLRRFRNEALATARLEHANIINVYAVGCDKGIHFYAMQLVDGRSLASIIRGMQNETNNISVGNEPNSPQSVARGSGRPGRENAAVAEADATERVQCPCHNEQSIEVSRSGNDGLDPILRESELAAASLNSELETNDRRQMAFMRAVAKLGIQVSDALHHAHEMGIIHRDVKPSNIMIDRHGDVLVTDFGLARVQSDLNLTLTGDVLGTLRYMSPEQALGQNELVDHRSDIFSIGATLYELLTLSPVCEGDGRKEILKKLFSDNIVPPSSLNPRIPADLETVILTALEFDPQSRYSSAMELAHDLQRFLDDEPIQAQRPTISQRVIKWSRRNRWLAGTVVAFFVFALIASLICSALIYQQNERLVDALERATTAESKAAEAPILLDQHGEELLKNEEPGKALKLFESALIFDSERAESRYFRAVALVKLGRLEDAVEAFSELIDQDSRRSDCFLERASAFKKMGRFDEAYADLMIVKQLTKDPGVTRSIAELSLQLGRVDEFKHHAVALTDTKDFRSLEMVF